MLSSAETIEVIAEALVTHAVPTVVLDPVLSYFSQWSGISCFV